MSERRLLSRHLRHHVVPEYFQQTVAPADEAMDNALDQLETEEPSLLEWLGSEPTMRCLLDAHGAATFVALALSQSSGLPLDKVTRRLDGLVYRLVATVALEATMRARQENADLEGLRYG